jgi:phosphinothricin acetyltransferase
MQADSVRIEAMTHRHAGQVLAIYQAGIDEGDATFETAAPDWAEFTGTRLAAHRFVAVEPVGAAVDTAGGSVDTASGSVDAAVGSVDAAIGSVGIAVGSVLGWVAASPTSRRPAYQGVVEHSVYVHPMARGRKIGRLLLAALIESTEAAGIWTIQSGIFPENAASVALHEAAGFRIVGRRERLARQHGRWRDVLLMERRSAAIS